MAETTVLTRAEFDTAEHFGTAGAVTALAAETVARWREQFPDWKAKHWGYTDPEAPHGARHLRPINVAPRTKK
ncbi:hypothetical protein [Nocardia pseudovaccinii]|uniref:hypothetical protein n=1 Tax=Nocardia pseudovaccinii TaxID=189540 RepID=UPI0007A3B2D1|nr:hypothetical protein [Nocardia pseudovaccinii]